jgi:aminoglycoside phosphotransferase family enzyme/predicted kinase
VPLDPASAAALAQHRALIDALAQRLVAAHGGAPLRRIDTHISSLLLLGDEVWKLKKPLGLGFLDFRSVDARRHFCDEELRLNRRTAPALYLGVQPVIGPADAPQLGPACAPDVAAPPGTIDWALHLRRFDDARLLAHLAERGELSAALVERLADRLVEFHAGLPSAGPGVGAPEVTLRWVRDNLAAVAALAPDAAAAERIAALAAWNEARAAALLPRLAQRHAAGQVRECHGDAHLANWVEIDGEPVAFDALEFNAELRWIDVAAELTFPWMDLLAHGLDALAHRLLQRWLERTGDFDALGLLRWQAVYRALVRVKVAWIHAAEPDVPEPVRRAERAAAEHGLALAERLAAGPAPRLVVTWGLSGAGKSTVAGAIAEALGAVWLRSDVERKRLFGMAPTDRPGPPGSATEPARLYGRDATERTYALLQTTAAQALADGWAVVVDAACLRAHERRALMAVAAQAGVPGHLLECRAPEPVLRARIARREAEGRDASDAGLAVLDFQRRAIEPFDPAELADLVGCEAEVIETEGDRAELARRCRDWARSRMP